MRSVRGRDTWQQNERSSRLRKLANRILGTNDSWDALFVQGCAKNPRLASTFRGTAN
jgi:hypothetical protein